MNLIITCQRNLEDLTILEIQNMLERWGDAEALIEKTMFSGIDMPASSAKNLESDRRINSPPLTSLEEAERVLPR